MHSLHGGAFFFPMQLGSPTRLRKVQVAKAVVVLLLTTPPAIAQNTPPPLPTLNLDSYPAAMRDSVAEAYRTATTRKTDADAVGRLARLLHAWEQWEAAHDAYARAQALAPRAFDWHYLDAVVLQRLARPREAATRLEAAIAVAPNYLAARVKLAEALFDAGKLDESRRVFEGLIREPAAEPAAHFGLGRVDAAEGRHDEAAGHFARAIALVPEWGAAHYALALSLRALGRRDEARRALERHAQYGPRWPAIEDRVLAGVEILRDDAGALLRRGQRLAETGDLKGAIDAYEAALARDLSLAVAHANLIKLYGSAGNWDKAESHYQAALKAGHNLADVHYDHGFLLALQSKWDQAAEAYGRAIAINPLYAEAHNNLGQVLERTRRFDAALDSYRHAVASQPAFRLARFNAGRMLVALGRPADAIAELAQIVEPRDAESPRYLFALSVAHIRAGHRDEGLKWAADAKRLATEYGQTELAAAIERELASLK